MSCACPGGLEVSRGIVEALFTGVSPRRLLVLTHWLIDEPAGF